MGTYTLGTSLGRGGLCEVLRARAQSGPYAGKEVALKRLLPERLRDAEARAMLVNEAEILRALKHPNILEAYELGEEDGVPFLTLERVEGLDLGRMLEQCRRRGIYPPLQVALHITAELLDALIHAHRATSASGKPLSLVHCDVSPGNVLLSTQGEVKLGDWGVASALWGDARAPHRLGKPAYRSPELLAGKVSPEADLWAAGVVLYELLTLDVPFPGKSGDDITRAIRNAKPIPVRQRSSSLPPVLGAVVDKALAASPRDRFPDAAAFLTALEPLREDAVSSQLALASIVRMLGTHRQPTPPNLGPGGPASGL